MLCADSKACTGRALARGAVIVLRATALRVTVIHRDAQSSGKSAQAVSGRLSQRTYFPLIVTAIDLCDNHRPIPVVG